MSEKATIENVKSDESIAIEKLFTQLSDLKEVPRVAIFSHKCPDPDAIGSMMGMRWFLKKVFNLESECFSEGPISHPQNLTMVNLLDPELKPVSQYSSEKYKYAILVDTVPQNAGVDPNQNVVFDLVIDHHKEVCPLEFEGLFVNLKAGSCAATVYHIIKEFDLSFKQDIDLDIRVATALLAGICIDTEDLMSDDSTQYEFSAWSGLFDFRDSLVLKKIVHFERPKFWVERKASSITQADISDGFGVVGMGIIPAKHRDIIADMSDEMSAWEDVHTSIAFAIVGGDRIEGSVRSSNSTLSVSKLCHDLGGKHGRGGGKLGKGAYLYELGGGGLEEDDDEDSRQKTWELFNEKERKRIFKILNG